MQWPQQFKGVSPMFLRTWPAHVERAEAVSAAMSQVSQGRWVAEPCMSVVGPDASVAAREHLDRRVSVYNEWVP